MKTLAELTSERSLHANLALLKNNARVAAQIAVELAKKYDAGTAGGSAGG